MSSICKGCGCSLPAEYADCNGDNRHKNIQDEAALALFRTKPDRTTGAYHADLDRTTLPETGIFVRALDANGSWGAIDIAHLDRASLNAWLRSRDSMDWPVNVVMILLGHPRKE